MNLQDLKKVTLWALWLAQWAGVMRRSYIRRPPAQKSCKLDLAKDTHIGRLKWENRAPKTPYRCVMCFTWLVKPNKTDQIGYKVFEKTFLVDKDLDVISASAEIDYMLNIRGECDKSEPLVLDPSTGRELTIVTSPVKLAEKMAEAGLSGKVIKGHMLQIGGVSVYANSGAPRPVTAGFMGFWTSASRLNYLFYFLFIVYVGVQKRD